MRRRRFIAGISVTVLWPRAARAEGKIYRLGILASRPEAIPATLFQELRALGYVEGENLVVEWRYSEGVNERWPALAQELVALKVDAILCGTTPAALAAKRATSTIPIVIPSAIDPVGAGSRKASRDRAAISLAARSKRRKSASRPCRCLRKLSPDLAGPRCCGMRPIRHSQQSGRRWTGPPVR
jgi:putative ABC transport system substrate-binding protein